MVRSLADRTFHLRPGRRLLAVPRRAAAAAARLHRDRPGDDDVAELLRRGLPGRADAADQAELARRRLRCGAGGRGGVRCESAVVTRCAWFPRVAFAVFSETRQLPDPI